MVLRLASLSADDLNAVLADLEADQRKAVERLLDELSGKPPAPSAPFDLARFSPWLVRRLLTDRFEGEMTLHAREILRGCAQDLFPMMESGPSKRRPNAWNLWGGGA
ncbi:MAG: hypothetical protein JO261_14940 [Alphaproteobacteria bacterium]|nr:hypothetical protein [Alphaproteobacteria bacterium]